MATALGSTKHGAKRRPNRTAGEINAIVLNILRKANGPLSAYDIAARAGQSGDTIVPNQVYRTIARLSKEDAIVRIESLSSYVVKSGPSDIVLICDDCRSLSLLEASDLVGSLQALARGKGFVPSGVVIELLGSCADCTMQKADRCAK